MSLRPQLSYRVPEETARVAHAVLPRGNVYLQLADTFGSLFEDADFTQLYPIDGQPALSPVRLTLVLILQFAEGLSDTCLHPEPKAPCGQVQVAKRPRQCGHGSTGSIYSAWR